MARSSRRWLAPLALAGALVGGSVAGPAVTRAAATPQLPPVTAAQLLERVAQARPVPLSGTVVTSADLGLPALPEGTAPGVSGLLAGDTTARVWYGGPGELRVAVTERLAERQLVVDDGVVTTYDSRTDEATRTTLPAHPDGTQDGTQEQEREHDAAPVQEAAERALAAVDPTTEVTVGRAERVAGRDAYELRLAPRDPASLIGAVTLAVDAETSLPLRVRVLARDGGEPAYEVGWTRLRLERPDPGTFDYAPPAGAEVKERSLERPSYDGDVPALPGGAPEVRGHGWTAVAVLRDVPTDGLPPAVLQSAQPVDGGRLLSTRLLTVFLADDGTAYAGAVTPDALLATAR